MSLNKIYFTLWILATFWIAVGCQKEDNLPDLSQKEVPKDTIELDTVVDGSTWKSILADKISGIGVKSMTVHESKLVITYKDQTVYSDVIAAKYDDEDDYFTVNEGYSFSNDVEGIYKFEWVDDILYAYGGDVYIHGSGAFYHHEDNINRITAQLRIEDKTYMCQEESPYIWMFGSASNFGEVLNGAVFDAVNYKGNLVVGGEFFANSLSLNRVALWDGSKWQAMGNGLNGTVRDLLVYNGDLIAVGDFTLELDGGKPCKYVARWDGSKWQALGGGLNGSGGGAMLGKVNYGELIIGGEFEGSNNVHSKNVIKWKVDHWETLANGVDFGVKALEVYNGRLYVSNGYTGFGDEVLYRLEE